MPPSRRRIAAIAIVVAFVAAACGSDGTPEISLGEDTETLGVGTASPDDLPGPTGTDDVFVTAYRDFNGGEQSLADVAEGKPVVLNFFASWCPTCVAEMPDFEAVNQQLSDQVQLVGLATEDAPGDALALAGRTGVTYPLGLDPAGAFFRVFQGLGMPTTAFLTAEGEVAHVFTGQLSDDALVDRIEEFLL